MKHPPSARVVVVNSILHSLISREGRPSDTFTSAPGISLVPAWLAYCSSNLSKLWFAYELQRRYPQLTVPVVHPGVIDSELTQVGLPTGRRGGGGVKGMGGGGAG